MLAIAHQPPAPHINSIMDLRLSGEQLVAAASAAAVSIAKDKSNAELSVLGDFFSTLGASLTLIADRRSQQGIDLGGKADDAQTQKGN